MNKSVQSPPGGIPRLILVAGFPGAGKTTAISRLAAMLKKLRRSVAIVTTAAGGESVDTLRFRDLGFATHEAPRQTIIESARRLLGSADVVFVEVPGDFSRIPLPAGNSEFIVAPLTVIVDPARAAKIFGFDPGNKYSEKLSHAFRQQIAQASVVIINDADSLPPKRVAAMREALERQNTDAVTLQLASKSDAGLEEWLRCLLADQNHPPSSDARSADLAPPGSLAALDCVVNISSVKYFNGDKVLVDLAALMQNLLQQESAEIGHLKMIFTPRDGVGGCASVSANSNDAIPNLTASLPEPIQSGRLVLNLRAEADPEILHSVANRALLAVVEKSPELFARLEHCEHFLPEPPPNL